MGPATPSTFVYSRFFYVLGYLVLPALRFTKAVPFEFGESVEVLYFRIINMSFHCFFFRTFAVCGEYSFAKSPFFAFFHRGMMNIALKSSVRVDKSNIMENESSFWGKT